MRMTLVKRIVPALAIAALVGCGSDSVVGGGANPPVGSYAAIIFVTTGTSGQTNQLTNGGSLNITLAANGTTSGHLHVSASGNNPALDADMAGTWTRQGNQIDFTQAADTFMNDLTFTYQPISNSSWHLAASQVIQGTKIDITLANTT
jgi:hypothetical protein